MNFMLCLFFIAEGLMVWTFEFLCVIVICEYEDMQYSDLSSRLLTIFVEFPPVLVHFVHSHISIPFTNPDLSNPILFSPERSIEIETCERFFRVFLFIFVRTHMNGALRFLWNY